MLKKQLQLLLAIITAAFPLLASAQGAISSTNYILDPAANTFSIHHNLSGASYIVEGSIEPITGKTTSSSYSLESGDAFRWNCGDGFIDPGESCDGSTNLNGATCASQGFDTGTLTCSSTCTYTTTGCSNGGGGGGGGGGASSAVPSKPTLNSALTAKTFTYSNSILLYGLRESTSTSVTINNSATGVTLPTATTWQSTRSLTYGVNAFSIIAASGSGSSAVLSYSIYRRLIGDLTQDSAVTDYDLSKFVKLWNSTNASGDFNEDGSVNDYDFSMLVARWGKTV